MPEFDAQLEEPEVQLRAKSAYNHLVSLVEDDDRFVGLVLGGSRGKGAETAASDYDCYVVTKDGVNVDGRELVGDAPGIEVAVFTLSEYRDKPVQVWNRYNFKGLKPVVDKLDGQVASLTAARAVYPRAEAHDAAVHWLGAYVNQVYRSLKNHRDGRRIEAALDAAESIGFFLEALFAVVGRLRPYNKYLRWELETDPFRELPWSVDDLMSNLDAARRDGLPTAQVTLFRGLLQLADAKGYGDGVRKDWGETLDWITSQ